MDVSVEVVGEATHEVTVGDDATYADLLREVECSPHEVSVLVDGSPVPEDQPVETREVQVLRLIKGGDGSAESDADPATDGGRLAFELPNVGPGPDPVRLADVTSDFLVLFFQRDYYCTNCRAQVQTLADRYDEFRDRGAEIASILPESVEQTREWQDQYDLPYPLLADPDAAVGDQYDQPVRFGPLGKLSDFFGRMPEVVLLDLRADRPEVAYSYRSKSTFDRPEIDDLLAELDDLREV
jgi:peroxiredoxin Q/BCP